VALSDVTAIVLAAGLSTRFGEANKLLGHFDGEPMVRKVVRSTIEAGYSVVAVTGHEADELEVALADLEQVQFAENARFPEGLGTSIACGVAAARDAEGWLIVPGDMPRLKVATLVKIGETGLYQGQDGLVACRLGKMTSPPCYFGRSYFGDLTRLEGDQGAKAILDAHPERRIVLEFDVAELEDVDYPAE